MALSQTKTLNEVLHHEADNANRYSRENGVIVSGQNLALGAVLGKITTGGKYTANDNTASDGSQVAVAVLLAATDATSADKEAPILRRHGTVRASGLVWVAGHDAAEIAAGKLQLAAVGIVCDREEA